MRREGVSNIPLLFRKNLVQSNINTDTLFLKTKTQFIEKKYG